MSEQNHLKPQTVKIIKYIINFAFSVSLIAIAILSLLPQPPELYHFSDYQDKIEHFIAYSILGALACLVLAQFSKSKKKQILIPVLFCVFYGFLLEIIQPSTGRTFDLLDILADAMGAITGTGLVYWFFFHR